MYDQIQVRGPEYEFIYCYCQGLGIKALEIIKVLIFLNVYIVIYF